MEENLAIFHTVGQSQQRSTADHVSVSWWLNVCDVDPTDDFSYVCGVPAFDHNARFDADPLSNQHRESLSVFSSEKHKMSANF